MKSTNTRTAWKIVSFVLALSLSGTASSAVVTNADVIKLLEAGMPEEVILQAISAGEGKFDTSANALIRLRSKGATPAILKAILSPTAAAPVRAAATDAKARSAIGAGPRPTEGALRPEDVVLVSEGQEKALQFLTPNVRTAARALGFGGVATYAGLDGDKAELRLNRGSLEFLVPVPKSAQPASYINLARMVVRANGGREISVASGFVSYAARIPRERLVPVTLERVPDQSRVSDGFVLYRVTTTQAIASGEFALVIAARDAPAGPLGTEAGSGYRFFDFGVD